MARITDGGHVARLERLAGPAMAAGIGAALIEGAEAISADARFSIIDGAISGSGHVPSQPYHAPNADSHDLDESIHVGDLIETDRGVQTAVIADSDHAWIEIGGSKILPRPYMGPATQRNREGVLVRIVAAVNRVIAG